MYNQLSNIYNKFSNDFTIKFNPLSLPIDFYKYELLDFDKIDKKNFIIKNSMKYITFQKSTFIVIESIDEDINICIGNEELVIKNKRLFLPIFVGTHAMYIGITQNIKIFTISIYMNDDNFSEYSNKLFNLLLACGNIYFDIGITRKFYDNNNISLIFYHGLFLVTSYDQIEINGIDENKFYYKIENEFINDGICNNVIYSEIYFIDNNIQSDIFKFCKVVL